MHAIDSYIMLYCVVLMYTIVLLSPLPRLAGVGAEGPRQSGRNMSYDMI